MLNEIYKDICFFKSDINEHLPLISAMSIDKETVIVTGETGQFRINKAVILGMPKNVLSVSHDMLYKHDNEYINTLKLAKSLKVNWNHVIEDTRNLKIRYADIAFVDSVHTYEYLLDELRGLNKFVGKLIVIHDTDVYGEIGEDRKNPALKKSISDFLEETNWKQIAHYSFNYGLTILSRVD